MKKIICIILLIFGVTGIFAQQISPESINTGGASFQTSGGGLSIVIGELVVNNLGNDSISLGQGFNQINQTITLIETIEQEKGINVYPNPVTQILTVQINRDNLFDISIELYDIVGKKIIVKNNINTNIIKLDLNQITNGTYILKIFEKNKNTIAVYKIQKFIN